MRKDGGMDKGDGDGYGRERIDERSRNLNQQDLVTEYRVRRGIWVSWTTSLFLAYKTKYIMGPFTEISNSGRELKPRLYLFEGRKVKGVLEASVLELLSLKFQ